MPRSFHLLDERADFVEVHARQRFQPEGREFDSFTRLDGSLTRQPIAERFIHGFLEGLPGFAHATIKLGPELIVNGQSGSHIMMLAHKTS